MSHDDAEAEKLNSDLIWGTPAIAAEIGKTLRETQYLIRKNKLPIGRLGPKTIFSSRKKLRQFLTPKESRGALALADSK